VTGVLDFVRQGCGGSDDSGITNDPLRVWDSRGGRKRGAQPPLSKIWRCELSVEEYAELGKQVEVPEQDCPGCEGRLTFWGWYERGVRRLEESAQQLRLWIRRSYCSACERTHALLPDFLHEWRRDRVEAIGQVLTKVVEEGRERVYAAVDLGLPLNTVRNLCQRHRDRAQLLFVEFSRLVVGREAVPAHLPWEAEKAALTVAREGWEQACQRRGELAVGGRWQWWSQVCDGRPLGLRPPTFFGSAQRQQRPEDGRITSRCWNCPAPAAST
jgi:hypothetical protein